MKENNRPKKVTVVEIDDDDIREYEEDEREYYDPPEDSSEEDIPKKPIKKSVKKPVKKPTKTDLAKKRPTVKPKKGNQKRKAEVKKKAAKRRAKKKDVRQVYRQPADLGAPLTAREKDAFRMAFPLKYFDDEENRIRYRRMIKKHKGDLLYAAKEFELEWFAPKPIEPREGVYGIGHTKSSNAKFVLINGVATKFADMGDLLGKLRAVYGPGVTMGDAEGYLEDDGNRIVIDDNGIVDRYNIKTDKQVFGRNGMLRRDFGVTFTKKSGTSKLGVLRNVSMDHVSGSKLKPETSINVYRYLVNIKMVLTMPSPMISYYYSLYKLKRGKNFDKEMAVARGKSDQRNVDAGDIVKIPEDILQLPDNESDNKNGYYRIDPDRAWERAGMKREDRNRLVREGDSKLYIKDKYIHEDLLADTDKIQPYYRGFSKKIISTDMALPGKISAIVDKYMNTFNDTITPNLVVYTYVVKGIKTEKKLEPSGIHYREKDTDYKFPGWGEMQYKRDCSSDDDSCFVRIISRTFPDLYWPVKNLETKEGISLEKCIKFCNEFNIRYFIYNEFRQLKYTNYRSTKDDETRGNIYCAIFKNHIQAFNGKPREKYKNKKKEIELIDNGNKELIKLINEDKIVPSNIKMQYFTNIDKIKDKGLLVSSYTMNGKTYVYNPDYEKCEKILKNLGLIKYLRHDTKLMSLPKILEKHFMNNVSQLSSFFPKPKLFSKPGFTYKMSKEKIAKKTKKWFETLITLDINKAYPYCLTLLPFLIVHDYRKHAIRKIDNSIEIDDTKLYTITVPFSTLLLPANGIYAGYHLKFAHEQGIPFILKEELDTDIYENIFKDFVELCHNCMEPKKFSAVFNVYIGMFERSINESFNYVPTGIKTKEELDAYETYSAKLCNNTYITFDAIKKMKNVMNRLPIANQIKDMCRVQVYKKIIEEKISDDDIYQIVTDSITYSPKKDPEGVHPTKFGAWKISPKEYKEISDKFGENPENHIINALKAPKENNNDKYNSNLPNEKDNSSARRIPRVLFKSYAGSGKSTFITNKLIPSILANKLTYVVLTHTHMTLRGFDNSQVLRDLDEEAKELCELYKKHSINHEISSKYTFSNTIPKVDVVIFDEIGFASSACHELLYKLKVVQKAYFCFGDFNQLPPVGQRLTFNQPHYLQYVFSEIYDNFINFRNNFSKKYYDSLINGELNNIKEVHKYSNKKMSKDSVVLCLRSKKNDKHPERNTREVYNKKILKKLGLRFNSKGAKVICKNNKLLDFGIFNGCKFTIKNKKDKKYILENIDGEIFKVTKRQLYSHFNSAYALGIHKVQGLSLKNGYYWAKEDDEFIRKDSRMAYTIISRIVQPIEPEEMKRRIALQDAIKYKFIENNTLGVYKEMKVKNTQCHFQKAEQKYHAELAKRVINPKYITTDNVIYKISEQKITAELAKPVINPKYITKDSTIYEISNEIAKSLASKTIQSDEKKQHWDLYENAINL